MHLPAITTPIWSYICKTHAVTSRDVKFCDLFGFCFLSCSTRGSSLSANPQHSGYLLPFYPKIYGSQVPLFLRLLLWIETWMKKCLCWCRFYCKWHDITLDIMLNMIWYLHWLISEALKEKIIHSSWEKNYSPSTGFPFLRLWIQGGVRYDETKKQELDRGRKHDPHLLEQRLVQLSTRFIFKICLSHFTHYVTLSGFCIKLYQQLVQQGSNRAATAGSRRVDNKLSLFYILLKLEAI